MGASSDVAMAKECAVGEWKVRHAASGGSSAEEDADMLPCKALVASVVGPFHRDLKTTRNVTCWKRGEGMLRKWARCADVANQNTLPCDEARSKAEGKGEGREVRTSKGAERNSTRRRHLITQQVSSL